MCNIHVCGLTSLHPFAACCMQLTLFIALQLLSHRPDGDNGVLFVYIIDESHTLYMIVNLFNCTLMFTSVLCNALTFTSAGPASGYIDICIAGWLEFTA